METGDYRERVLENSHAGVSKGGKHYEISGLSRES